MRAEAPRRPLAGGDRRRAPLIVCALALAFAAGPAGAEVRVERLPDGSRIVRNAPPTATATVARQAARPAVASVRAAAGVDHDRLRRLVAAAAEREGVDRRLVEAVVRAESAWNPAALSHKGAIGLMQLMPATAGELSVDDPWDAADNVGGGVRYMRQLLDRFDHLEHAIAAYNAGPSAVERHGGVPPYRETRDYVRRVLAFYDGREAQLDVRTGPPPRLVRTVDGRRVLTNAAGDSSPATAPRASERPAVAPAPGSVVASR